MDNYTIFLNKRMRQIDREINDLFRDYDDGIISDYVYGQQLLELSIRKDELENVLNGALDGEEKNQETSFETCSTCTHWEDDTDRDDFSWCWEKEHPTFGIENCSHYKQKHCINPLIKKN